MKIRAIVRKINKRVKKELYILYRRFMRTVARFILACDNCPKDYQKRYRESAIAVLCNFLVVLMGIIIFMFMAVLFA